MLAFFVMTRFEINSMFIAAALAIIGYSINDTIVVFDRFREELAKTKEKITKENYKNYHVVGVNSYGKSHVQKSLTLNSGSSIKFSIEKWLTPSGKIISEKGLVPDVVVEQSPVYYVDQTVENDAQLQEALSILKKES